MKCPHCNFDRIPDGVRFCPNCGQLLPANAGNTTVIQVSQEAQNVEHGAQMIGASIGQVMGNVLITTDDLAQARDRRNLRILLDKVKNYWVKGVLEGALRGAVLIDLNKLPQPAFVMRPLEKSANPADTMTVTASKAFSKKQVSELFDEMDRALLLLDGVGSGKTISLLELARDLAARADQDPIQPIPVVLNLASWTLKKQTLKDWVIDELNVRYQIPTKIARQWLEEGDLGILLDGLDEVDEHHLRDCILAINDFRLEHGLVPIGICCRTEAYTTAKEVLNLGGAVILQLLTEEQVNQYLDSFDPGSQAIRQVLSDDETMQSLARSPLMLNMIRLAYQDLPVDALKGDQLDTPEERRQHLLDTYVERTFSHDATSQNVAFNRNQVTRFLTWLGVHLRQQNQSAFLMEQIQPGWLTGKGQRWIYWMLSRGLIGLLIGLLLAGTAEIAGTPTGRIAYILSGALAGSVIGFFDGLRAEFWIPMKPEATGWQFWRNTGAYAIGVGILAGLAFWFDFGLVIHLGTESLRLGAGAALAFGLVFGAGWRPDPQLDVRTAEALTWSWKEARLGILPGLLLTVATIFVIGLIFARSNPLAIWLPFGLIYGLLGALGLVIICGLRGRTVESKSFPNQGIWLSMRNSLRAGLLLGLSAGLIYGLRYGLLPGIVLALRAGVLIMLIYGAFDVLKHGCLRLMLNLGDHIPWQLSKMLDYTVGLGFMQKAGGGYLFANRLLQEYFARQETSDPTK